MKRSARPWVRALVTGASSGIGEELARQLAARGTNLIVVARSTGRLDALAAQLRDAFGVDVEVVTADLTVEEQLAAVVARLHRDDRPVDLLVNNAGVSASGHFAARDRDAQEALIRLNVVAAVRLAHAAAGRMRAVGHGGILNVSSIAGWLALPGLASYSATKAFSTSFSQALHEELAADRVHVTALCPGLTPTNLDLAASSGAAARHGPLWTPVTVVARAGLDGVARNHAVVVPGGAYRLGAALVRALPGGLVRRAVAMGSGVGRSGERAA